MGKTWSRRSTWRFTFSFESSSSIVVRCVYVYFASNFCSSTHLARSIALLRISSVRGRPVVLGGALDGAEPCGNRLDAPARKSPAHKPAISARAAEDRLGVTAAVFPPCDPANGTSKTISLPRDLHGPKSAGSAC